MAHLRAQDHDGLLEGFQGTSKTKAAESWCSQLPESSSGLTWWPRIVGRDGFEIRVYDKGAIGAKDISGASLSLTCTLRIMPASRRPPHFALPGEPVYCPNGHKLEHDVWPLGEDPMTVRRCSFKWPPGNAGVCGLCVYWMMLPGGSRIVVEVTSSEAHHMEQERMSIKEVLAFLNLRWVRPDPNRPPRAMPPVAGAAR